MDISTNNTLTAISYGAAAGLVTMAAANAVLVGVGAGAKVGAYVADYFKRESVAQNLRIKCDQLISLAGKYAATELKVAAALVAIGGGATLAEYVIDNEIADDKMSRDVSCGKYTNHESCIRRTPYEMLGVHFYEEEAEGEKIAQQILNTAQENTKVSTVFSHTCTPRHGMPDVVVKERVSKPVPENDSVKGSILPTFFELTVIMIAAVVFVLANSVIENTKSE